MNNNDILRRTRYILDLKDNQITKIFKHVEVETTEQQINLWLKREDEESFVPMPDKMLINFLNALIIEKRGLQENTVKKPEAKLDNNLILMKLKIALHLKAEDALEIMELADFKISKHEFSALFRKKDHKHYRACKNQMLRKFMKGLQLKYRGGPKPINTTGKKTSGSTQKTQLSDQAPKQSGQLTLNKKAKKVNKTSKQTVVTTKPKTIQKNHNKKTAASVWKVPKKPIN